MGQHAEGSVIASAFLAWGGLWGRRQAAHHGGLAEGAAYCGVELVHPDQGCGVDFLALLLEIPATHQAHGPAAGSSVSGWRGVRRRARFGGVGSSVRPSR